MWRVEEEVDEVVKRETCFCARQQQTKEVVVKQKAEDCFEAAA